MNYYIQGNAAKADKIKAAFEKLGIDVLDFGFADKTVVYCSIGGACVQSLPYSINLMHILYSHPDYKELELPVEPKFKVGDWLYPNCNGIYPVLVTDYNKYCGYQLQEGSDRCHLSTKIIEKEYHLWTIADAKDGDVLITENGNPFIFCGNKVYDRSHDIIAYGGLNTTGEFYESYREDCWTYNISLKPATKEQRDMLFKKMKEAGYTWDAYKKELKKIKPHYDIANFKPFDHCRFKPTETHDWIYADFWYVQAHYKVEHLSAIEKWES